MTGLEKAAIARTLAEAGRPSLPGARLPDPLHEGHWLGSLLSPDEVTRLMASPDFIKGWGYVRDFLGGRLGWIMAATPAELRKFTGAK